MNGRQFLRRLLYTPDEVKDWVDGTGFPFGRRDAELGYVHRDRVCREGVDHSLVSYVYDERTGARKMVNHAGASCRVNTYGDSFTSCEQVNGGETWQELLAASLGEPVRNYGVGGYSVYQTLLRMRREERRFPGKYIIFNIFDDDHYRNLAGWQRFLWPKGAKHFHPPQPYVSANPHNDQFEEHPNPCPTPQSLKLLCDIDSALDIFGDDFCMKMTLAYRNASDGRAEDSFADIRAIASEYGEERPVTNSKELLATARAVHDRAAIFATMEIIKMAEEFAAKHDRRMLYVLSYGPRRLRERFEGGPRFDQPLIEFMGKEKLLYEDQSEAHVKDHSMSRLSVDDYLGMFYVLQNSFTGHYSALGNLFQAQALREPLLGLLSPKPPSYRSTPAGWDDCVST